jgi:inward rectifier potassium channel
MTTDRPLPLGEPRAARRVTMMPDGMRDIERIGVEGGWRDTYHFLMTIPIMALLGVLASAYLLANAFFALLYLLFGDGIANARPGVFADAFFFSVQTMATIGYGAMFPQTIAANLIATTETVYGMLTVALSTGILFARISRPTARLVFSKTAVIGPFDGQPMLMFRVANHRRSQILSATISLTLLRNDRTIDGHVIRRFHDLKLVRAHTPAFSLTFTVMHPIDRDSPLFGMTLEMLAAAETEIFCSIIGIDETFTQTVHARGAYGAEDLRWNARFVDILHKRPDGRRVIDYTRFHDTIDCAHAK